MFYYVLGEVREWRAGRVVLGCGPGGPPGPYFLEWVVCFLEWLVVFSSGFVCFLEWLCKIQSFLAFWHPRGSKTVGKCMFLCFLRAAASQKNKKLRFVLPACLQTTSRPILRYGPAECAERLEFKEEGKRWLNRCVTVAPMSGTFLLERRLNRRAATHRCM